MDPALEEIRRRAWRDLERIRKPEEETMEQKTKPGIKTTEFWFTLAAQIIGGTLASGVLGNDSPLSVALGAGMMVLSGLGYGYGRARVKTEDARRNGRASHAIGE